MGLKGVIMHYDSYKDTNDHIKAVKSIIYNFINRLLIRIDRHDKSKLESPEKEILDVYTPILKGLTYGSDEYFEEFSKGMKPFLKHHYANNSHHPEHYKNGINGMDLIDLIEMFCDWKAATMRHTDGNIQRSFKINKERFKISDQLLSIMKNTVIKLK